MPKYQQVRIACEICGKSFLGRSDRRYCSTSCFNKNKHNQDLLTASLALKRAQEMAKEPY